MRTRRNHGFRCAGVTGSAGRYDQGVSRPVKRKSSGCARHWCRAPFPVASRGLRATATPVRSGNVPGAWSTEDGSRPLAAGGAPHDAGGIGPGPSLGRGTAMTFSPRHLSSRGRRRGCRRPRPTWSGPVHPTMPRVPMRVASSYPTLPFARVAYRSKSMPVGHMASICSAVA